MEAKTMRRFFLEALTCSFVAVTASADLAQYLDPNRNTVATDADPGLPAALDLMY